jgi:hypothetical protein
MILRGEGPKAKSVLDRFFLPKTIFGNLVVGTILLSLALVIFFLGRRYHWGGLLILSLIVLPGLLGSGCFDIAISDIVKAQKKSGSHYPLGPLSLGIGVMLFGLGHFAVGGIYEYVKTRDVIAILRIVWGVLMVGAGLGILYLNNFCRRLATVLFIIVALESAFISLRIYFLRYNEPTEWMTFLIYVLLIYFLQRKETVAKFTCARTAARTSEHRSLEEKDKNL